MMPVEQRQRLQAAAASQPGMTVLDFVADPIALMRGGALGGRHGRLQHPSPNCCRWAPAP